MSTDLARKLHAAFEHLADTPAPPSLVPGTLRRGRQQRRLQLATAGVAVAAVAAGGYTGAAALTDRTARSDAAAGGDIAVTAVSCQPGGAYQPDHPPHSRLLTAAGGYKTVPYCAAVPSPDLTRAVVTGGTGLPGDPQKQGILDVASGQVAWIAGFTGIAVWSPDGSQVMLHSGQAGFGPAAPLGEGYVLVDAANATARLVPSAARLGEPVWRPNGAIALVRCACPAAPASRGEVLDPGFYTEGDTGPDPIGTYVRVPGEPLPSGRITIPGRHVATAPSGSGPGWESPGTPVPPQPAIGEQVSTGRRWSPLPFVSPDGNQVAFTVSAGMGGPVVDVAATATGRFRHRITLPAYNEVIGWYDNDHLITHYLPRQAAPGAKDTDEVLSVISVRTGKVERTIKRDTGYGAIEFDADVTVGTVSGGARKPGF
jgi:hypothetical protein